MMRTSLTVVTLIAASVAFAGDGVFVLEENQVAVQVNGVVWGFCGYGAEKAQ